MDNLEYIDNYFSGSPDSLLKKDFEKKIHSDSLFAQEVSFYLSAKQVAKETSKDRFKEIYAQYKQANPVTAVEQKQSIVRRLRPFMAAAAVIAMLVIGLNILLSPASPKQLADQYVKEHFQTLSVTMSSKEDSLQIGLRLFSEKKPEQALLQFESIMTNDPSDVQAKRYAGITALNLKQYDKALKYFEELENYPGLQVNPGKFFHAITLMERGQSGDKELAKQLLMKVDEENLDGKKQAREWLKKF